VNLLTAYCAAKVVYENGQRSGVVENLTVNEFFKRVESEKGDVVISCHHHKTGPQGVALPVVNKAINELLEFYYKNVRQRMKTHKDTEHLFFLTANGKQYTQVYRKIQEAIAATNIKDIELPPPSKYRIVVHTDASKVLSDQGLRKMAKHMSHSSDTARQYYEFSNITDAINVHDTIVDMAKRRKWTSEETNSLLMACLLTNLKPDLKTCAMVKEKCNHNRTPKNIQDKWRQLKDKST